MNALAPCAETLHGLDRRVGHASERAPPAGMGCADDDGLMIGEQHRGAVGGQDSEQQIGPVGDHRIGARALVLRPGRIGDNDFG